MSKKVPKQESSVVRVEGSTFEALGVPADKVRLVATLIALDGGLPEPRKLPVADILEMVRAPYNEGDQTEQFYRDRIRSPLTAIRAYCVTCVGGPREATNCKNVKCALWLFRRGRNPFRTRAGVPEKDVASDD